MTSLKNLIKTGIITTILLINTNFLNAVLFSTTSLKPTGSPVTNVTFDNYGRFFAIEYANNMTKVYDHLWLNCIHQETILDHITSLSIIGYSQLDLTFQSGNTRRLPITNADKSSKRICRHLATPKTFSYFGIKAITTSTRIYFDKDTNSDIYVSGDTCFYAQLRRDAKEIIIIDGTLTQSKLIKPDENVCLISINPEEKNVALGFNDGSVIIYKICYE